RQERRCVLLHRGTQGSPAKVFQHEIIGAPFLTEVHMPLDERMAEALANLRFAFVARKDLSSSDQLIRGELEDHLLQCPPVLGQVDKACASPPKQADDLVVVNPLTCLIDCWHTPSWCFLRSRVLS